MSVKSIEIERVRFKHGTVGQDAHSAATKCDRVKMACTTLPFNRSSGRRRLRQPRDMAVFTHGVFFTLMLKLCGQATAAARGL